MTRRKAEEIVGEIIDDLTNRSGIKHAWYDIDVDIREEIRAEWINIVMGDNE